jgi:type VI secretion system protein ImpL
MIVAAALIALVTAVWFGGPMLGFGEARPLETVWARALIIALVLTIAGGYCVFRYLQQPHAQDTLDAVLAQSDAEESDWRVLQTGIKQAVATLKRSAGKGKSLHEVPWYLVIGPPGVGKTTALVNAGLKILLATAGERQPASGTGSTRYCDWWFAEDAVLVDTAGRYTMQDTDTRVDRKSWLAFLSLLKQYRGSQPINGVILAFSLEDLMTRNAQELGVHVISIRNRLQEIHERLQTDFPVYVLFTKADLVAGFAEYFGEFDEGRRRKVWGVTFPPGTTGNNVAGQTKAELGALADRLAEEATDRLHEEQDPTARIAIFAFPAQFGLLRDRISDFLGDVFGPVGNRPEDNLRGFYFSSGAQEGRAIDQVLGAIGPSYGSVNARARLSGAYKSFFLHDVLSKVIFAEAGLVLQDKGGARRAAALRYGSFGVVALLTAALLVAFGLSFATNRSLIASTNNVVEQLRLASDASRDSTTVADADLENVIETLQALRDLPVGYETRELPVPVHETFGLSQRARLVSAAETTYRQALERMFRSRLILQLEQTISARMGDPIKLYEPLKIYLMLGGKAPKVDDELVVAWMKKDWEQNRYPGSSNRGGRVELERHLRAMLELDDAHEPVFELNRSLVESAQRSLGRMTLAERASALIRSAIYAAGLDDFSVSMRGGPEAALIFETVDGRDLSTLNVPGIYTYAGFNNFYLPQLASVAQKLVDDQWVIGAGGAQGLEQELPRLGPDLINRYGKDFGAAWNSVLDKLKFKAMSADKPHYVALSAAASPASPIKQLFEAIAAETALTREAEASAAFAQHSTAELAKGLARIGIDHATGKSQSRAGAAFAQAAGQVPGANIEAQFRPFHLVVSGPPGQRPIDILVQNFHDIHQSLLLAAAVPSQTERVNANLQLQISSLRANASRLPNAMAKMVHGAADAFEGDAAETSITQLNRLVRETVTGPCQEAIANRFPFAGSGAEDIAMADFVKMFAPNGVIDRFFAQNLAPLTDMSGQNWEWNNDTRLGRELSNSSLKAFQLAAEIRDAFFPLGSSTPAVDITFTPFSLHSGADMALLDVNGQIIQSYRTGSVPGTVTWPGDMASGSATLSLTPELPGRESTIKFDGAWGLKRLLDSGSLTRNGDDLEARFVIGGRDVAYTIKTSSAANPFSLPALSAFNCPTEF